MNSKSINTPFRHDLLAGKTALVTGAGKGIGRESARFLCASGAKVFAVARTESELLSLREELGSQLVPWVHDATSEAFYSALKIQKDIDVLVNNLGTNVPQPYVDVELETFDRIIDINVRSLFRTSQIIVRNLLAAKRTGSIINISSQMGHIGSPNRTIYCLSKHAVEGLSKALAVELAPAGIRVNSIAPTFIETAMTKPMLDKPEFREFVLDMIPMQKIGQPRDVASAVVYLASDASDLVTGTSLRVDGGWTAQ